MMKKSMLFSVLLSLFCAFFLTGCGSTAYYRSKAAESARRFLLENAPELTAEQIYFVKYNDPVLLTSPVLGTPLKTGNQEKSTSYLYQICVTWNIPGAKNLYMVFGVSDARMFSWQPIRLIRKDFTQKIMPEDAAVSLCRKFAVDSLHHALPVGDLNRIRFEFPFIARTGFKLNFNTTGKMTPEEVRAAEKAAAGKVQYSLYWMNSDGKVTVFCGVAKADLSGWSINFAGIVTEDELKQNRIGIVRTPEQSDRSIAILKQDQPVPAGKAAIKKVKKDK